MAGLRSNLSAQDESDTGTRRIVLLGMSIARLAQGASWENDVSATTCQSSSPWPARLSSAMVTASSRPTPGPEIVARGDGPVASRLDDDARSVQRRLRETGHDEWLARPVEHAVAGGSCQERSRNQEPRPLPPDPPLPRGLQFGRHDPL